MCYKKSLRTTRNHHELAEVSLEEEKELNKRLDILPISTPRKSHQKRQSRKHLGPSTASYPRRDMGDGRMISTEWIRRKNAGIISTNTNMYRWMHGVEKGLWGATVHHLTVGEGKECYNVLPRDTGRGKKAKSHHLEVATNS
jgi:hypothetical protein